MLNQRSPRVMHIGMGLVCGSKIKELVKANFEFIILLADWHSWINNKLGGDTENIRACGEYFKHCFTALGIKQDKVQYLWTSEIADNAEYWERVIRIAKNISLQRTWRALPIMGREMSLKDVETAWVYYPCMQAADIFHLDLDVVCAGMDQRKAHMLARDVAEKIGWKKPVCIHTPLLMGLRGPERARGRFDESAEINIQISSKMSKSLPATCIYIHDTTNDIQTKMRAAYCPPRQIEGNPIIEIAKYIVYASGRILEVPRQPKYGGPKSFKTYEELEKAYIKAELHPLDLKGAVAKSLSEILRPVRQYFRRNPRSLEKMKNMEISR